MFKQLPVLGAPVLWTSQSNAWRIGGECETVHWAGVRVIAVAMDRPALSAAGPTATLVPGIDKVI